jgi:outer membrane protein assembly factor BamB
MRIILLALLLALLPMVASTTQAAAADPSPSPSTPTGLPASPLPVPSIAAATPTLDPAGPLAWTRITASTEVPAAREDHTLVVDPDGQAAWLFGGRATERVLGDLWRLDLATDTWSRVEPSGERPSRRFGHAAVWLPGLGMVIFGGQAGATFHDDLWAFDPDTGVWRLLPGDGRRPEARYGTCAAVGPDGRLWISHGFTGAGRFGDTRAWNPATGRWTVETPRSGKAPVERCLHDCVWAPDGRLQLFGGQTNGVPSLGDSWSLDPIERRWRRLDDPAAGPRRLYAVAVDGPVAWVFGGSDDRDRPLGDLWRWDLATGAWVRAVLIEGGVTPASRSGATAIADAARGRVLLFGGLGARQVFADLWELAPAPTP